MPDNAERIELWARSKMHAEFGAVFAKTADDPLTSWVLPIPEDRSGEETIQHEAGYWLAVIEAWERDRDEVLGGRR